MTGIGRMRSKAWTLPNQQSLPRRQSAMRGCRIAALLLLSVVLGWSTGCTGTGPVVGLKSDEVAGRIQAMKLAAERRDKAAVPDLVAALESEDPAERLFAIEALERITGQNLGYHYYDSDAERAEAVKRWKERLAGPATRRSSK
jgi:hypothetical protein